MRELDYMKIPIAGLKFGKHKFSFKLDKSFFENFDNSEIQEAKLFVDLYLEKTERFLAFTFRIKGIINVSCDLCLDDFPLEIDFEDNLYINYDEEVEELQYVGEELTYISRDDQDFDVSHLLYEYSHLALPVRRVHPDNINDEPTCNPEMIKKINELSYRDEKSDLETDPRWEKLKKLKNNNN